MAIPRQVPRAAITPRSAARTLVLALAALVAALAATALRPGAAEALTVGFMDPATQTEHPEEFWADMTALRGGVLRYDLYWREIAPVRPSDPRNPASPEYDWKTIDRLVRDANAHGVEVLFTLWRTPTWARADGGAGPGGFYSYAPNLDDWGNFVHAAAVRYSGFFDPDGAGGPEPALPQVTKWEMWNEPNYIGALRPQRIRKKIVSPAIYAGILNRGFAEIQTVEAELNIRMDVLGGAMNRGFGGAGSIPALKFLQGMKKAKAKFDIASLHPYPLTGRAGVDDGAKAPNITLANFRKYERELDRLWPAKRYTIWLTEYGAQTQPDRYGATLEGQQRFVKTAIGRLVKRHPRVTHLVWFLLRDEAVELPGESDNWQSGLRGSDGVVKPAYQTWVDTVASLL